MIRTHRQSTLLNISTRFQTSILTYVSASVLSPLVQSFNQSYKKINIPSHCVIYAISANDAQRNSTKACKAVPRKSYAREAPNGLYVRVCACIHVCVCICLYAYKYVYIYEYMYLCMRVHMYVGVYACMYFCMYLCACACVYACMCVCTYSCSVA